MLKSRLVTKNTRNAACMLLAAEAVARLNPNECQDIADVAIDLVKCEALDNVEGLGVLMLLERWSDYQASDEEVRSLGFEPKLVVDD